MSTNWKAVRAQFKFDVQTGCPILDEYENDNFTEFTRKMNILRVPAGIQTELLWAHFLRKAGIPGLHYEGGSESDVEEGTDMKLFTIVGSDVTTYLDGKSDCVFTGISCGNEIKVKIGIRYGNSYGNTFSMPVTVLGIEFPDSNESSLSERIVGAELAAFALYTLMTNEKVIKSNPYKALADAVCSKDKDLVKKATSALRRWMMSFQPCAA